MAGSTEKDCLPFNNISVAAVAILLKHTVTPEESAGCSESIDPELWFQQFFNIAFPRGGTPYLIQY